MTLVTNLARELSAGHWNQLPVENLGKRRTVSQGTPSLQPALEAAQLSEPVALTRGNPPPPPLPVGPRGPVWLAENKHFGHMWLYF